MVKNIFKFNIVLAFLCLLNVKAQTIQTYPIGFHNVESVKSILPDYQQAIDEAQSLVGIIKYNESNGTGYLFYNSHENIWEVHSAYHVVDDALIKGTPITIKGDSFELALDHSKIISSDEEHLKDRVRYEVSYERKIPEKIKFESSSEIQIGSSTFILGYPGGVPNIKTSMGHTLFSDVNKNWNSTAVGQRGVSGGPAFLIGPEGVFYLCGTAIEGRASDNFATISYKVDEKILPSILSTMDVNSMLTNVSLYRDINIDQLHLLVRQSLNKNLLQYLKSLPEYPKDRPSIKININYNENLSALKRILEEKEEQLQAAQMSQVHSLAFSLQSSVIEYLIKVDDNSEYNNLHNYSNFPFFTIDQWNNTSPKVLKENMLAGISKSLDQLEHYNTRMNSIKRVFEQETLLDTIAFIQNLNIESNEANFLNYIIPVFSNILPYEG